MRAALLCTCVAVLAACASTAERTPPQQQADTPAALHERARQAIAAGQPQQAALELRRLETLYPDDALATTARMETVFAHYQAGEHAATIAAAERFIRLHPDHPDLDYLYYLRGLARFSEATADLGRLPATATGEARSAHFANARLALRDLGELIGRFPDSRYSADARKRVAHLRQQLAEIELKSAQDLLNHGQYANAGLLARALIENYPDSGLATDAAIVVNMSHRMLAMENEAAEAATAAQEQLATEPASPPAPATGDATRAPLPGAEWIARQDPASYTLQLFSTSNEEALLGFVRRHRLHQAAYFRSGSPQQSWFSLIHGVYDTVEDARNAAERLPAALRGEKPWIRRMGELQAIISPG
jgi:outer membrane protein assembly factor BamD